MTRKAFCLLLNCVAELKVFPNNLEKNLLKVSVLCTAQCRDSPTCTGSATTINAKDKRRRENRR